MVCWFLLSFGLSPLSTGGLGYEVPPKCHQLDLHLVHWPRWLCRWLRATNRLLGDAGMVCFYVVASTRHIRVHLLRWFLVGFDDEIMGERCKMVLMSWSYASVTYPGVTFSFGWLNAGFVLGYVYPRKWWMRGRSAIFFTRKEVDLDSLAPFRVFCWGLVWAAVGGNGGREYGVARRRHAPVT